MLSQIIQMLQEHRLSSFWYFMKMAINFTGEALRKINKEGYKYWGATAREGMVILTTVVGFSPLLHSCPHTPIGVKSYTRDHYNNKDECSWSLCLRREQSRGSNSNAGKMVQTWSSIVIDHCGSHFLQLNKWAEFLIEAIQPRAWICRPPVTTLISVLLSNYSVMPRWNRLLTFYKIPVCVAPMNLRIFSTVRYAPLTLWMG